MRNLLEEFLITHGKSKPTILGVREHIFTGRLIFLFATNIFKGLQFFLQIFYEHSLLSYANVIILSLHM